MNSNGEFIQEAVFMGAAAGALVWVFLLMAISWWFSALETKASSMAISVEDDLRGGNRGQRGMAIGGRGQQAKWNKVAHKEYVQRRNQSAVLHMIKMAITILGLQPDQQTPHFSQAIIMAITIMLKEHNTADPQAHPIT